MAVSRWGRLATGGVAVAVVAAGLTVGAGAAGASSARKAVVYRVSKSGYVSGAGHLRPGRIKIKVHGSKGQSLQLVRSRHGAGKAQLLADAGAVNAQGDPNPLERDFVLAGGTQVGQALYVTLKRGTYYAVDVDTESPTAKKVKQITVSGKKVNAAKPSTTGVVTAIKSESWSNKPKSIAHQGVLRFQNHAKQSHFIVLSRLKKGKTRKDIGLVLRGKEKDTDVFYSGAKNTFDSGVISPKGVMSTTYKLPKGNYALLCFWPDRKTHMPHAFMGMYRVLKLK